MATYKVLFVDDEPNILHALKRQLHRVYQIETATNGYDGLKILRNHPDFAVVLSDLRMPVMNGIEFLAQVREIAPSAVRMMLTGNADLQAAIEAVNEGNIFRFMTKPCPINILTKALEMGVEQHRLISAEKELLEKTLRGSVQVLSEVLEIVNPQAFGRASRIKRFVRDIAYKLAPSECWRIETAAMLSQIGCIILPSETMGKINTGQSFSDEELQVYQQHPFIGSDLISQIPRMEEISEIIVNQEKQYDGGGIPKDSLKGAEIPLGARILKVLLDFDNLEVSGHKRRDALDILKSRSGWYDHQILKELEEIVVGIKAKYDLKSLMPDELSPQMILAENLRTKTGQLMIAKGHQISRPLIARLKNLVQTDVINETIQVLVPLLCDD